MAQASSAQREPSMEEILASIRRIIEDSDPAQSEEGSISGSYLDDDESEEESAAESVDVESFRSELRTEPAGFTTRPAQSLPPRGTETQAFMRGVGSAADKSDDLNPGESGITGSARVVAPADAHSGTDEGQATEAPALAENIEPAPLPAAEKPEAEEASAVVTAKSSIISDATGRKVAAAFGELNEAFEASRRRSFDEMAEEMLRPMLQDWLDNNLPTLVEKLVREEIERVARGGAD